MEKAAQTILRGLLVCVGTDALVRGDAGSSVLLAKRQRGFRHDLGNRGVAITEMDRASGSQDVESRLGHLLRKTEAIGRIEAGVREPDDCRVSRRGRAVRGDRVRTEISAPRLVS